MTDVVWWRPVWRSRRWLRESPYDATGKPQGYERMRRIDTNKFDSRELFRQGKR